MCVLLLFFASLRVHLPLPSQLLFPIEFDCFYFQRKNKYTDSKLKALKARNEYILCLEASNTTIHKYFVDDLSDLIDVCFLFRKI